MTTMRAEFPLANARTWIGFVLMCLGMFMAILDIQVRLLRERLAARRLTIELTDAAREYLANAGFDPAYGARPLKRTIQRRVLDPLAMRVLEGEFHEGDRVVVEVNARYRDLEEARALVDAVSVAQRASREKLRVRTNQFQIQAAMLADVLQARADMAQWTGCIAGALTRAEFERALANAGLTEIEVNETHRVHEHAGSAIIRARKPA